METLGSIAARTVAVAARTNAIALRVEEIAARTATIEERLESVAAALHQLLALTAEDALRVENGLASLGVQLEGLVLSSQRPSGRPDGSGAPETPTAAV